jgi:hypothetical protein
VPGTCRQQDEPGHYTLICKMAEFDGDTECDTSKCAIGVLVVSTRLIVIHQLSEESATWEPSLSKGPLGGEDFEDAEVPNTSNTGQPQ